MNTGTGCQEGPRRAWLDWLCPGHVRHDMLASKSARPISNPGPLGPRHVVAVPKIPRPSVHRLHHKVTGCRARRIKQHCGERRMGGGHLWPVANTLVAGGRRSCRSCCCMCRMFFLCRWLSHLKSCRSGQSWADPRIESRRRYRVVLAGMPGPTLMCCSLCAHVAVLLCCSFPPRVERGESYPSKHQPRCSAGVPPFASRLSLASPPAHLIDSPATRIATRHRDRFFSACVIHAGRGVGTYLMTAQHGKQKNKH